MERLLNGNRIEQIAYRNLNAFWRRRALFAYENANIRIALLQLLTTSEPTLPVPPIARIFIFELLSIAACFYTCSSQAFEAFKAS